MNIVQLVYEGIAGGVLRVALEYDKNLKNIGHEGILITSLGFPEAKSFYGSSAYYKFIFKSPKLLKPYISGFFNQVASKIKISDFLMSLLKNRKVDWILCHNLTPALDALYLAKRLNSKLAIIIHNPTYLPSIVNYSSTIFFNKPLKVSLTKSIEHLKQADLVLAIHKYNVDLVRDIYYVKALSISLGCNPVLQIPEKRGNYMLIPARLSLGKQIHMLAKAVALADKSIPVVIAGARHHSTPKVIKNVRNLGLKKSVVLMDVPRRVFEKLFLGARAVLYGLSETDFLMPASHGAPIICLKKKYAGDVLEHGKHGYLIDGENVLPEKYAKYILKLIEDERLSWTLGYNAWKVSLKHTWYHATKELINILNKNG